MTSPPATARPASVPTPALSGSPPATAAPDLEEFTSFDALSGLRDAWDAFAAEVAAPAYLSFDACETWWRHYGHGRELRVLVFREGGAIVGILPAFIERLWLGPNTLRVAALVGSDSTLPVLDLPLRAESARRVLAAAFRRFLGEHRCTMVRLSALSGASVHLDAARGAVQDLGGAARIAQDEETGVYTAFDLPATFDEYLSRMSGNQRSNWRRKSKSMKKDFECKRELLTGQAEVAAAFEQFLPMHEAFWRREGKLGHFGDWPGSAAYHRDLLARHAARGHARVLRLSLNGEPVAIQVSYTLGGRCHWFLPARVAREDLERYSIGTLGLVDVVEDAISAGLREVETGVGRYEYKVQIGATERPLRSFVVSGGGLFARLRVAAALRCSRLLHLVYYRGWYLRCAPRFPSLRRPLWKTWIRTRF